jgi:hypothetical protein
VLTLISDGQRLCSVVPLEGLCHGFVEIVEEGAELGFEIFFLSEISSSDHLSGEDGEPDFDLDEPGGVLRREMESNAVARIGEEVVPAGHGFEDTVFAFFAQVAPDGAVLRDAEPTGDAANHALGEMGIEVVEDDGPAGFGQGAGEQGLEEAREVVFLTRVTDLFAPGPTGQGTREACKEREL